MNKYWNNSSQNKIRFQQSFIQWVTEYYKGAQQIVLGGGSKDNVNECLAISNQIVRKIDCLQSTLEEADDRIMMHIGYESMKGAKSIIVASSDTDILVCLLYHSIRWMKEGVCEIWNVRGSRGDSKLYPLHTLCSIIGEDVALQLPAAHSLTGCDTVSKVGTKHAALKALPSVHLENFGTAELTEEAIDHAEHFMKPFKMAEVNIIVDIKGGLYYGIHTRT